MSLKLEDLKFSYDEKNEYIKNTCKNKKEEIGKLIYINTKLFEWQSCNIIYNIPQTYMFKKSKLFPRSLDFFLE